MSPGEDSGEYYRDEDVDCDHQWAVRRPCKVQEHDRDKFDDDRHRHDRPAQCWTGGKSRSPKDPCDGGHRYGEGQRDENPEAEPCAEPTADGSRPADANDDPPDNEECYDLDYPGYAPQRETNGCTEARRYLGGAPRFNGLVSQLIQYHFGMWGEPPWFTVYRLRNSAHVDLAPVRYALRGMPPGVLFTMVPFT